MKTRTVLITVGVILLVLLLIVPGLFMMGLGGGFGGMMGGRGMMWGGYGWMHPFGWFGMLLGWLVPIALLVLVVLGVIWLVNKFGRSGNLPLNTAANRACPVCGKPVQTDWKNCPYCGNALQ